MSKLFLAPNQPSIVTLTVTQNGMILSRKRQVFCHNMYISRAARFDDYGLDGFKNDVYCEQCATINHGCKIYDAIMEKIGLFTYNPIMRIRKQGGQLVVDVKG